MALNCLAIVGLPLGAFLILVFIGKRLPRQGDFISVLAILGSFVLSVPIFLELVSQGNVHDTLTTVWISLPMPMPPQILSAHSTFGGLNFNINVGILVNNLTAIMLCMVSLCAFLIHLFSTGYMKGEERYHLFFAYISLFSAAMLGLVVSDNLLTFFVCWEIMGLCSYLLIGFYYKKPSAINASLKAFMTTRIGDVGLFLGIMGLFAIYKTTNFTYIYRAVQAGIGSDMTLLGMPALTFIGFMVLMGAIGKSAQFPLHVWLPDAMEGPTPVSALIHAATMVAAGVFLLIRMYPLLEASHGVLIWVAYVGAITAFLASLLAIVQFDIKKVLAYSTISQLGYMVMGVGVGAFAAAFLHLITHAFFKACLFLGSGSVIHSVHTQDMRQMGGLKSKMPYTFITMLIATFAISGLPFFSGFVSKDRILAGALGYGMQNQGQIIIPILGFTAAAITAFYMFRLIYMTFCGPAKDEHKHSHAHEQPWNMVLPLVVLAGFSFAVLYAGFTGIHALDRFFEVHWFDRALEGAQNEMGIALSHGDPVIQHTAHNMALWISLGVAGLGILLSTFMYLKKVISPETIRARIPRLHKILTHKYYFDELYLNIVIQKGLLGFNRLLAKFDDALVDRYLVDGWRDLTMLVKSFIGKFDDIVIDGILVDGTANAAAAGGWALRRLQTGKVQQYLTLVFVFFVIAMFFLVT